MSSTTESIVNRDLTKWDEDERKFKVITPIDSNVSEMKHLFQSQAYIQPESATENIDDKTNSITKNTKAYLNAKRIALAICAIIFVFLCLALAITMITLFVFQLPSYGDYGESCDTKTCLESKQLMCMNQICTCEPTQTTWNTIKQKCELKSIHERNHGEYCIQNFTICNNSTHCIGSICQCDSSTQYWDGISCVAKKTYQTNCSIRATITKTPIYDQANCVSDLECAECLNSSNLACDSITGKCKCQINSYYDTRKLQCVQKKSYFEYCNSTIPCDVTKGLYCKTSSTTTTTNYCPTAINQCDCTLGYYYDYNTETCLSKKTYTKPCSTACECDNTKNFFCYNGICQCPGNSYFDGTQCVSTSMNKLSNLASCSSDTQCDKNVGLYCDPSGICNCVDPSRYYWSKILNMCIECPSGWTLFNIATNYSRCYFISNYALNYFDSRKTCTIYRATLYVINDVNEYNIIRNYFLPYSDVYYFIGMYTIYGWGTWYWDDGRVVNFASGYVPPWWNFNSISEYTNVGYLVGSTYSHITNWVGATSRLFICEKIY